MLLEEWLPLLMSFVVGLTVGVCVVLMFNKLKSGNASPMKLKQEMQDYQQKVEEHFETTSVKFKNMTMQYQDLYQHLATGEKQLCRAEHVSPLLSDGVNAGDMRSQNQLEQPMADMSNSEADSNQAAESEPEVSTATPNDNEEPKVP